MNLQETMQGHLKKDLELFDARVKEDRNDDIRDIAIRIVDELVRQDVIASDVDTDNETEFQIQDVIFNELKKQNLNFEDEEVEDIWRPFL